jgi:hypothetical protein
MTPHRCGSIFICSCQVGGTKTIPQAEMDNLVETADPARSKGIMVAINP